MTRTSSRSRPSSRARGASARRATRGNARRQPAGPAGRGRSSTGRASSGRSSSKGVPAIGVVGILLASLAGGWFIFGAVGAPTGGEPQAICALVVDTVIATDDDVLRTEFGRAVDWTLVGCTEREADLVLYAVQPGGNEFRPWASSPSTPKRAEATGGGRPPWRSV